MTPEAEAVLTYEIGQVVTGFQTAPAAGGRLWGVVDVRGAKTTWLIGPLPYIDAVRERVRLQTEAILQLVKELVPDARDEGLKARGAA